MGCKVPITLDKPRVMMDGLYSQMKFCEVAGKKISEIDWENALDLANRLWSLLVWEDPSLTVAEVALLVDDDNADMVFDLVLKVINGEPAPLEETTSEDGPSPDTTLD